jgi:hypothetical protein
MSGLLYPEILEVPVDVQIIETEHQILTSCLFECFKDSLHIFFYASFVRCLFAIRGKAMRSKVSREVPAPWYLLLMASHLH